VICSLAPTPPVYKRNYLMRGDEFNMEDGTIGFDVVTEQVFPDRPALLAWLAKLSEPGSGERVVADEEKFLDRNAARFIWLCRMWGSVRKGQNRMTCFRRALPSRTAW
jgi:hypothetical protein